jgi:hypothetical protein
MGRRRGHGLAPEESLQVSIAEYLWRVHPGVVWWHTPNGGGRSAREGAVFKRMGVVAGVPDLALIGAGGRLILVELKARGGRVRESQRKFMARAEEEGALCFVVRDLEEMVWLMNHLVVEGLLL